MTEPLGSSVPPPEVVEAFSSAALIALRELTGIEAFHEPTLPTGTLAEMFSDDPVVSALMRLLRPSPGLMSLVLTTATAARVAARYLPAGTPLTDDMLDDVIGEFVNVIAGQSKTMLKGTPYHFTLSTPVVTRASSVELLPAAVTGSLVAMLTFEEGQLLLCVDLGSCPGA